MWFRGSFQNRAEQLKFEKGNAQIQSKNENIRDLWRDSSKVNVNSDSLLIKLPLKQALRSQKVAQTKAATDHFLTLGS